MIFSLAVEEEFEAFSKVWMGENCRWKGGGERGIWDLYDVGLRRNERWVTAEILSIHYCLLAFDGGLRANHCHSLGATCIPTERIPWVRGDQSTSRRFAFCRILGKWELKLHLL